MLKLIQLLTSVDTDEGVIDSFILDTWKRIFNEGSLEDCSVSESEKEREESSKLTAVNQFEAYKKILRENTSEALKLGAFGVPFWKVKRGGDGVSETFFGSDRFDHIEVFLHGPSSSSIKSKL